MHPQTNHLLKIIVFSLTILTLSSCSALKPRTHVHFNKISVDHNKRTHYLAITPKDLQKIRQLSKDISNLSPSVDKTEAYLVAYEAVLYPKVLANQYQLMSPPNYHNQLVNAGKRKKGHCYHFAQDMMKHLDRPYKTLTLERVMAYQGKPKEHHVPSIRAKGQNIREAIALDAWINSATLSWVKLKEDNGYPWVRYTPRKAEPYVVFSKKEAILHVP